MPQHAVSASLDNDIPVEEVSAAERQDTRAVQEDAIAVQEDALTCSPPLAWNDISAAVHGIGEHPLLDSTASAASGSGEECRDGNNDNIPNDNLPSEEPVVVDGPADIVAAGQPARPKISKPVAAIGGVLALLGLGAGVFAYSGSGEQKNILPPKAELAAIPPSVPEANTPAPLSSSPEANTRSAVAVPPAPEATPAPPALAQPEPVLPPAAPEEKTAALPNPVTPQTAAAPAETVPSRTPEDNRIAAVPNPQTPQSSQPAAALPRPPVGLATPPAQGPARGQIVFVQRPGVNIRNAPSQNGQVVGAAQFGGRFIVAKRDGEWVQVEQGPWRGWINQRFLGPRLPRG